MDAEPDGRGVRTERQEQPSDDHREEERERDVAARPGGFLARRRHGLEPDKGEYPEHHRAAERPEAGRRLERHDRVPRRAALRDDHDAQRGDDDELHGEDDEAEAYRGPYADDVDHGHEREQDQRDHDPVQADPVATEDRRYVVTLGGADAGNGQERSGQNEPAYDETGPLSQCAP